MTKLWRAFASLAVWVIPLIFVACGGDNPAPNTNKPPVSSFMAASNTIKAGDALLFTSSSSDPDGDVLTQSWDFGDDTRGGGSSIAHVFPSAGAFIVKLTVGDGKGGSSNTTQSITVTAGEPVGPALEVKGEITDTSGLPLAGVAVKLGSSTLGTSDANGKVMVSIPTGPSQTLMLFKEGYTDQVAALEFPIGSTAGNGFFKVSMMTQAPSQPMNATTGGAITGEDNAKLEIPANGLETENGTPITGNVQVSITPLDVSNPAVLAAMPGRLEGIQTDGSSAGIVSLGMTDFSLRQNGQDLNLKPGSSAKVRIPLYADTDESGKLLVLGDTIPLWSMSETTGEWVQEGIGTVVDTGNGIKALEATVTHFSLWNADHIYDENLNNPRPNPPLPPLPIVKPKCKIPPEIEAQLNTDAKKVVFCLFLSEAVDIFGTDGPNPNGANMLRPQATTPRLPAWSARTTLPLAGGTDFGLVPPNRKIRYTACVFVIGKELCGSEVKTLQRGTTTEFDILMLPVQEETVTVPLDITRSMTSAKRQFTFNITIPTQLYFNLEPSAGSTLNATVDLLQGNDKVFSGNIASSALTFNAEVMAGKYTLEVAPLAGATGNLRIQIQPIVNESVTLPFDATRSVTKTQRFEFDSAASPNGVSVLLERGAGSGFSGTTSLFNPTGTVMASGAIGATALSFDVQLSITGKHILEVKPAIGSSGDVRIKIVRKDIANTIAFDTDLDVVQVANKVDTYSFNATQGQRVSLGLAWSQGAAFSSSSPSLRKLNDPNGVAPTNGVYTLQTAGVYQITVTNFSNATGTYRLRLNTVRDLMTLNTLDPLTEITTSLNLGEVRRYVLNPPLTLGEVIALRLESASSNAPTSAYFRGFPQSGLVGNNGIRIGSGVAPQSKLSEITFVPISTDTYWLYLDGNGLQSFNTIGQIGGQFTLGIFRPSAQALALDSSVSSSININTLQTYRVNVPADGSYLLRSTIAAVNTVTAEIWNSDVPRIVGNVYRSDKSEFNASLKAGAEEIKGGLKAGHHTITIHNKKIDNINPISTPTNYNISLVMLENPTDLAIGAPAVNGLIDVAGERDYYRFNATVGQAFTITATSPAFTGTIRIHKLSATKDFTTPDDFNIFGGSPYPIKALGTHTFTIPTDANAGGTGTYIIEIDATGVQTGTYSLGLTSP